MAKTKKTIRFYSKEEKRILAPFVKKAQKTDMAIIEEFSKKYNRNVKSVLAYIYNNRKKLNIKRSMVKNAPFGRLTTKKDKSLINLSKGEFNIPIKEWNISQTESGFYFNVKF